MKHALASALILCSIAAAPAPAQAPTQSERESVTRIVVYGTDPCPPSPPGEIVVCARRPESERYRIPERMRELPPSPESDSWGERARVLERQGRTGIQSCSPVGPGGASGCLDQFIDQARRERQDEQEGPKP